MRMISFSRHHQFSNVVALIYCLTTMQEDSSASESSPKRGIVHLLNFSSSGLSVHVGIHHDFNLRFPDG